MEKRSLQSGNTFFPVVEKRLTGSPAASAFWNSAIRKARGIKSIHNGAKLSRTVRMQWIFQK